MSTQHITVTTTDGQTVETTTSDPETARYYEDLPFNSSNVSRVDVTVTED